MPERLSFRERVVVITGGAGGIGAALGRAFAAEGARVALLDLDGPRLERAVAQLPHGRAIGVEVDVRDAASCEAALARVRAAFGRIDVLVNNAGISHRSLFEATRPEVLRRLMDVNFFGAVHCTAAALPELRARRGLLVTISSVAGFAPLVGRTGYAASKHALHGFFDSLRAELRGEGVGVMLVCPSFVATEIERRALSSEGEELGETPRAISGALMTPDELARRVVAAAARRDRLVTPSPISRASLLLSRLAPRLYERLMLRSQGGEFGRA